MFFVQKTVEVKEEGSDNSGLDNSDSEEDEAASSPTSMWGLLFIDIG